MKFWYLNEYIEFGGYYSKFSIIVTKIIGEKEL
jgi:hypothetical protein